MRSVVFDSFALLALFRNEPGAGFVASLLADVRDGRAWGGVCPVNLGEVYYIVAREHGALRAEDLLRQLLGLEWHLLPMTNDLVWEAARLKARHPLSYADALAVACARQQGAELVTNDPETRRAEHGVTTCWEPE
jgi:ribonuclease VapC